MGEKMSNIMDMLNGVEVEWKALGEEIKTVTAPSKLKREAYRDTGRLPIIDQGIEFIAGYTDENITPVKKGEYVIFGDHSEHIKYVDFSFVQGADGLKILSPISANSKYIYYAFQNFYKKEFSYKRHWSTAQETLIPIPYPENPEKSLVIQTEIVRILDAFTALTAELTAELTARKKQYNYYRDKLLTFEDEVPVVQLSHCCVSIADGDHQAPPKTDMGIPFITISNVSDAKQIDFINTRFVSEAYYDELDNKRKARKNDILYTVVGSLGIPIFIDNDRKFAFQRHIAILRPNGNVIIPKYLYHVFRSSDFLKQAYAVAVGAAQKTITLTALNRMKIPMPPLDEQARIVAILDKFDALTNSITEGLPREIKLRQQQYAYYRDLLLSFPKAVTETPLESVEKKHG